VKTTSTLVRLEESACGLALEEGTQAYNQAAFSYFLEIERRRSERSNRPFMLLLADLGIPSDRMEPDVAASLLSGLEGCLRETDVVGWYVNGQVAGAVLTERASFEEEASARVVRERVTRVLTGRLPRAIAHRLQVRVYAQAPFGERES
jgi:hypothetical protein